MKILLDTSLLVAALVESHTAHERAFPWLLRIRNGDTEGFISAHTIAELYAVLTRLPIKPRIPPKTATALIRANVIDTCQVVSLNTEDYQSVIDHLAGINIIGGATFDALIMRVAIVEEIDQVVTLNPRDFTRIYPELSGKIIVP